MGWRIVLHNVPRRDGLKLLEHAHLITPHILAIIITGYDSVETLSKAILKGVHETSR